MKISYICLSFVLFLTACGTGATPIPPTAPPTVKPPTAVIPPTTASTSSSPTPTATSSTVSSGECTDAAVFVDDVTVADYTHMNPREAFTKTWRIKNSGTCAWTPAYSAAYSSGDHLGIKDSLPLSNTAPGATLDISTDMVAPAADGTYKIFYTLENPSGKAMTIDNGNTIWAIITVGKVLVFPSPTPNTASSTGGGTAKCVTQSNAAFVSQTLALINSARATNGQSALTLNAQLTSAAQQHSVDMACSGSLSHTGTDGSTSSTRIAAAGYKASIDRENIYAQPPQYGGNPQAAMDWWMSDQIHRDAILNAQVTQVGIGYAAYSGSPLGGYFTVDLAAP